MSLYVTYASAISLMGTPAEIYVYGISGMYHAIPYFLSLIIANSTVVPLLYPLRLTSTYEVAYMGIALYAPGLALQIVAGVPLWLSIVVIGLVGTIYTAIGGIKSVVWTDVFQFVIIVIGLAAVVIKLMPYFVLDVMRSLPGLSGIFISCLFSGALRCVRVRRQHGESFQAGNVVEHDRYGGGSVMVWGGINLRGKTDLHVFHNGTVTARIYCDEILDAYARPYVGAIGPDFILMDDNARPPRARVTKQYIQHGLASPDLNPIEHVWDILQTALSARNVQPRTLQELGTALVPEWNAIPQNRIRDLIRGMRRLFAYGLVAIGLAYAINSMSGSVVQMSLSAAGACGGPLAGLFFLGGMVPKANWVGAVIGSVTALVFNIWIPEEVFFLYNVSYTWYGFIGFFLTLIIGTVVSLCTGGDRGQPVEARLIFPICRKICGVKSKHNYDASDTEDQNHKDMDPGF
ncbi:sodium-dependent multivitamin transporter-like [Mizuhopecten yessoensis]|uniref:sodium-dependent multivitamin transporter-like n=1 Tax=Mizuhopecten yessoensis TaxID=6573 RepID=UPI000B45E4CE|nr:sodium-dependent multivitamin transporter-like [Mizuhopecten yessoensis]